MHDWCSARIMTVLVIMLQLICGSCTNYIIVAKRPAIHTVDFNTEEQLPLLETDKLK